MKRDAMHAAGLSIRSAALYLAALGTIFPLYWIVVTALRAPKGVFAVPPRLFPDALSLGVFHTLFSYNSSFGGYLDREIANSLSVSVVSAVVSCLLAIPLAWLLAYRFTRALRTVVQSGVILVRVVPAVLILPSLYMFENMLHTVDTVPGLLLVYIPMGVPFAVWLFSTFFSSIPRSVIEAAEVDGASDLGLIRHVVVPVSLPAMVSTLILSFITVWNEFMFASVLEQTPRSITLPIAISQLQSFQGVQWQLIAGEATLMIVPGVIMVALGYSWIKAGMVDGAVKA